MIRRLVTTLGLGLLLVTGGAALPGCYRHHYRRYDDCDDRYVVRSYRHYDYHDRGGRYHDYRGWRHGR